MKAEPQSDPRGITETVGFAERARIFYVRNAAGDLIFRGECAGGSVSERVHELIELIRDEVVPMEAPALRIL